MVASSRIGEDVMFMTIAETVAKRSTCMSRNVGAVLVRNRNVIAIGYNGTAAGLSHCSEIGCLRRDRGIPSGEQLDICRAVHAEMNCILFAARNGVSVEGSTLYCTNVPCNQCALALINSGVTSIVAKDEYPSDARELLCQAGVSFKRI